jgi:hypothetical protein
MSSGTLSLCLFFDIVYRWAFVSLRSEIRKHVLDLQNSLIIGMPNGKGY